MSIAKPKIKLITPADSSVIVEKYREPYRHRVLDSLKHTQLRSELHEAVEEAIYDKAQLDAEQMRCSIDDLYFAQARHIIVNLKTDNSINNQRFIEMVNSGTITPTQAVQLTPQEMHYDRWKTLIEKKTFEMSQLTKDPEATTDMFWCPKCHRNKCTYFERQDRSADEPMTVHVTCCYCGNRWKF